jgi:hypothetical protein
MNYTNRLKYGYSLSSMMNWTYTTYLRGQYKFSPKYVDNLMQRLINHVDITGVFASIEKDRQDEHNHVHLLLASNQTLSRYKLGRIAGFNHLGIGNVDKVYNKEGVAKYVCKHIGKDYSYHNLII